MKTIFAIGLLGIFCVSNRFSNREEQVIIDNMKLNISFGNTEFTASMFDNPTTKDFMSMLPMTVKLEDYAGNEKIFYPKRKLTKQGAPSGYKPLKGDITYYAPWGDVAIFYKDFSYSSGLIPLGHIGGDGIEKLQNVGDMYVTFELIKE